MPGNASPRTFPLDGWIASINQAGAVILRVEFSASGPGKQIVPISIPLELKPVQADKLIEHLRKLRGRS